MKNIRLTVAALGILLGSSIPALAAIESASAAQPCVVAAANHFTVNADNTITASFQVKGDAGCTQPVSVISWVADSTLYPKPEFFTSQTIKDVTTQTFGVGTHALTVKLPLCSTDPSVIHSYQADVVAGANPATFITAPGTPGYYSQTQADGSFNVVDYKIAPGTCPAATPVVTPTAPVTPPSTPVTEVAQPTSLVNTGPGSVAALFAIAVIGGAIGYRAVVARKDLSRS